MPKDSRIFALVVAAGTGSRAGGELPKQYQPIAGKPMLRYAVEALATHPAITAVQVVIHPAHAECYRAAFSHDAERELSSKLLPPIHGGEQRSDSVRAGLATLVAHAPDYLLIHDAARPFLSHAVIDRIIEKLSPEHAVFPALPVHDTVRRRDGERWSEVSRDGLLRIQTPQAFPFAAFQNIIARGAATDDAAVWLAAGNQLVYVEGEEELRKVTTPNDIAWAEKNARLTGTMRSVVGMGFDVHALIPSGAKGMMRLGGIDIPCPFRLEGHSDADVALHALVDALLGTITDGDIGQHFPPGDARWKGADSAVFVTETVKKVRARGGAIQHVDLTIICEAPKIAPHRDAMRACIAKLLDIPLGYVSVKATTTEKLGLTGRGEGIAAQAVVTVTLPEHL